MNGATIIYLLVLLFIFIQYRKQVKIAKGWKDSAIEVNKLLNDYKTKE